MPPCNLPPKPDAASGELPRVLGFWGGVAVVVGTTIGSGIFRKPATLASLIPDPYLILALWALFGLIVLCGALTFAELGGLLPRTGGIYVYLRSAYGDAAAFVFGWLYLLVTVPAAIGALAVFFGRLLEGAGVIEGRLVPWVAIGAIVALTAANIVGVRQGAVLQKVFTLVKVAALAGLIGAVFLWGGDVPGRSAAWALSSSEPPSLRGVALAVSSFMWTYSGWQAITMMAGELGKPERDLTRVIGVGVLTVVVLYVGANVAYFSMLPLRVIAAEERVASRVMTMILGSRGGAIMSACIMASVLGALNGQFLAKTRVGYALARDGLTFRILGRCHPRWSTPYVAILVPGAVAIGLVIWLKSFDALTTYFAVVEWSALIFAVAAVFVLRRRQPEAPRPYRVPLYPWTPLVFVVGAGTGLGAVLWAESLRHNGAPFIGLAIAAAGFPVYALWRRLSARSPAAADPRSSRKNPASAEASHC